MRMYQQAHDSGEVNSQHKAALLSLGNVTQKRGKFITPRKMKLAKHV